MGTQVRIPSFFWSAMWISAIHLTIFFPKTNGNNRAKELTSGLASRLAGKQIYRNSIKYTHTQMDILNEAIYQLSMCVCNRLWWFVNSHSLFVLLQICFLWYQIIFVYRVSCCYCCCCFFLLSTEFEPICIHYKEYQLS